MKQIPLFYFYFYLYISSITLLWTAANWTRRSLMDPFQVSER